MVVLEFYLKSAQTAATANGKQWVSFLSLWDSHLSVQPIEVDFQAFDLANFTYINSMWAF